MRLYNAQSCTPTGTSTTAANTKKWSPPRTFVPRAQVLVNNKEVGVRTAMDTRTRGVQVLPKRKQSQSNNQVLSKSKKESQSQSLLLINKSPPRKTTTTTPLSMSSSSSSSISRAVEPFPFPLSMSLTGSSSFSPPRWGPPDMVLTLFPTPPRPNVKVNDKVRTNTSTELSLMKSSPEIFKTTTGTTATSSDNDNDNDCDDHDHYNNSYSFNEPFYFDIDDHDQQDAILNEEDHRHGHSHGHGYSRSLPIPPPPEQEQPMARDYTYSWEEFSRDSSSTISTWNQEDLEDQDRNPSESRRVALVLEHDDDDDDDEIRVVASTSASGRCWESPLAARRMATAAGKVKETLMTTGNYSNHDAGLSRSNVGFRQGILPLEIEKTIATSAWPPHQSFAVTPAAEESKNLELALFPTREPHAHATFTFEPQWERAVTVVPSIERPTEGNKDDTNTVMGPWINFRLPENPFAPDSEFSSCYDDDIPRSPFAPIEQPSLPPKKAFVVASPQADRAEQKKTKTLTKSPRKMERAARTVTAAAGPVINYSSAGRVSVQHAPFATNVVAGRVHHDESVAFVGGRIVAKPRQNNDGPSRASREAVAAGSKAATKPVRSFVVNAKARRRNLGPGIAAVQSLRKKEAKAVAEAAKSFVANSKSDCQNFGQGAVTELVESNPVKELVANPNSDRQRVDQGAVTELVKANLVKSFVANPNSDRQNVGQGGAVTEQVKSNPVKSFISNSNYALQHLNHGAVTEPVKSNPIKSFVANSNSRQPLNHGAVTELVKSNPVKPIVANSKSRRQRFNHGAVTELVKSDPVKAFVADSNYAGQNVGQGAVTEPVKSFVVNAKAGRNLGQGTVAEHSRREKESSDSTTQSRPMQRRAPLLLGHLLEERYQAARRKDLLPRGPVAVDGEKNAESDDAVRSIQETPALAKYAKMLKVGLPISAIKNAMERDGADLGVFDNGKCKPSGLSDDPAFAKYARMLKVGLPVSAVKNAMERDGVDPCVLDGGASGPTKAGKNELVASEAAKDPYRRFRLHWETHSNVRSNTIWAMVSRDQDWLAEFQVDEEEVETLFRASKKSTVVAEVTTTNRAGSDGAVRVIDPQRANNGGIILARIKFSYRDIARAVDSYDIAALTLEQIRAILPYIPTAEERHDLQGFISKYGQPPKTECEKFMVEILAVDEAKRKLEAMLFMKRFPIGIEELKNDARLIHKACDEIMSASRFRKVLGIVLHLGNLLNTSGSTSMDMAGALKVESLLKLHQAKAFDKKTTFLQYAACVIRRNSPTLLQFKDDLHTLTLAEKVNWEQSLDELDDMEASLSEIRQLALASGAAEGQSQVGVSASLTAEDEVRCLQSTYIGSFTVDASLRMASAYGEIESSKRAFEALLNYFGEEERSDIGPREFLRTLSLFCDNFDVAVEQAIASEKQKVRETRSTGGPRYPTRIQRLEVRQESNRDGGSSSGMGSILADIRKRSAN